MFDLRIDRPIGLRRALMPASKIFVGTVLSNVVRSPRWRRDARNGLRRTRLHRPQIVGARQSAVGQPCLDRILYPIRTVCQKMLLAFRPRPCVRRRALPTHLGRASEADAVIPIRSRRLIPRLAHTVVPASARSTCIASAAIGSSRCSATMTSSTTSCWLRDGRP